MIDPNQGQSEEVLRRLKEASYERFRIELVKSIERLMEDFQMTWDDLADKLNWENEEAGPLATFGPVLTGDETKRFIGSGHITTQELNDITHVFSAEPYVIFRPRKPWTQS